MEATARNILIFFIKEFSASVRGGYLEYSRLVDCAQIDGDDWRWPQILLVYTNSDYRPGRLTLQEVHSQYHTTCLNVEELCQTLEVTRQDPYRLMAEKERSAGRYERLVFQVQETAEQLAASAGQHMQLREQLQQSKAQLRQTEERLRKTEEENAAIGEELVSAESKNAELEENLKERNYHYDSLYAYSARRDRELEDIQNSRSYRFFLRFIKRPLQIGYRAALKIKRMILYLFTFRWGLLGKELVSPFCKVVLRLQRRLERKK